MAQKIIDQHIHLSVRDYPSVILLAFTRPVVKVPFDDAEGLIEFAGRICYDSTGKLGDDEQWINKRIKQGHESILEHASASFLIRCSRAVSHELVRHRLASFSQRSQRYVAENDINFIVPNSIVNGKSSVFHSAMQDAWNYYRKLLSMGVSKEEARYVLPNACVTELIMTMNFRELRHFIAVRSDKKAMTEMRAIAKQIFDICCDIAPKVFNDISMDKEDIRQ